ncbi:MAG TPA: hypothetical protein VIM88_01950 [Sulfurovum sp.]|uniref:hypothetical protein n=1 Tax=Sulfurovum sp. TaxID=1969726 RepID=UPI002F9492CC
MYKIHVENECSCFKKSAFVNDQMFKDKEDALMKAKVMECRMNQEFCHTHYFEAEDMGDEIIIRSVVRADYEDDDDDDFI